MVWKFLTSSFPRCCSPLAAGSSVVAVSSVIAVTLIMTVTSVLVIASATNALSVMDAPSVMAIAKLMTVTLIMAVASVLAIAFVWAVTSHVIPVVPPSLPTPGDYHMGCSSRSIVSTPIAYSHIILHQLRIAFPINWLFLHVYCWIDWSKGD